MVFRLKKRSDAPLGPLLIALLAIAVGCDGTTNDGRSPNSPPSEIAEQVIGDTKPNAAAPKPTLTVRKRENEVLHNLLEVTGQIYSGSEPKGEAAFEALAEFGIKTIVSVDGARPDVERASKHGIRYVHVPIGYDGIHVEAGAALARVAREAQRPIYFHCHHGQHRGPAAAAVACVASGAADRQGALDILRAAGTGKNYAGLWKDVAAYRPPPGDADLPPLVEVALVPSLAAAMATLDRRFDNLKLCHDAEWKPSDAHPDLVPPHEALLVREALTEAGRQAPPENDRGFKNQLQDAIRAASELEQALRAAELAKAEASFQSLDRCCKDCHASYRN